MGFGPVRSGEREGLFPPRYAPTGGRTIEGTCADSRRVSSECCSFVLHLNAVEQPRLQLGRHAPRNAPMQAVIDAVDEGRIPLSKQLPGLVPAAREALLLPDLVEPA